MFMAASEDGAHGRHELLADVVARDARRGTAGQRRGAVAGVGFWSDDDDPVAGEAVDGGLTAGREVPGVDDEEVGSDPFDRCGEHLTRRNVTRRPTAALAGQQLRGVASHDRVTDSDQDPRGAVAHRAGVEAHPAIVRRSAISAISSLYGTGCG